MKHSFYRVILCVLIAALFITAAGCSAHETPADSGTITDLMNGITPDTVSTIDTNAYAKEVSNFSITLLNACHENSDNTLVSPVSVMYALTMTGNGARENTQAQMETVMGAPIEDLNTYLYSYHETAKAENQSRLSIANSIWFTEDSRFSINPDFLQTCANYYDTSIFKAAFTEETRTDINKWICDHTNGRIAEILDTIPPAALMYLINAVSFDGEWVDPYTSYQVQDGDFTAADGSCQNVQYMHGEEHYYLKDDQAQGFIKYYKGHRFAFAALLPNEGISLSQYISSLDGETLHNMLSNPQRTTVETKMPKFSIEYKTELSNVLSTMGMADAFNPQCADFSGIGSSTAGNISISRVLHKTFIAVDESGTTAAAATVVEMKDAAAPMPQEVKTVHLDRPFLYMIIDTDTNIPLFIGTLNQPMG